MLIDKSWTYLRNRLSDEYWNGISAFIEVAKNYATSIGHISCPCMKCRNHEMHPVETVRAHIHRFGFDPLYRTWIYHGEVEAVSGVDPIVNQPVDEMFAVLEDVAGINDDHRMLDETHVDLEYA
ncbi:hypothetical protein L484_014660 [Morus notabilis]|uniref:Transposase-associated domain-containing protein n=1 Tax=Morus notabilis TaxID=981085 RepID=W9RM34_9ROSA|nr:hypothetical protein L484_014660 [Morus notabilis]